MQADRAVGCIDPLRHQEIGLETVRWEDKTGASMAFFHEALERVAAEGRSPVGLHLLMGDEAPTMFENVLRNLEEGRACVAQAVLRRPT